MITVNDWAEIRRLHAAEGLSQRAIAKRFGDIANDGVQGVGVADTSFVFEAATSVKVSRCRIRRS